MRYLIMLAVLVTAIGCTGSPAILAVVPSRTAYECSKATDWGLTYQEVEKAPAKHATQTVTWTGKVFNIDEGVGVTLVQAWYVDGDKRTHGAFVVVYGDELPGVYKDTTITVCGRLAGVFEGKNAYGAAIVQPRIDADVITRVATRE